MRLSFILVLIMASMAVFVSCVNTTEPYDVIITEKFAVQQSPVIGIHLDSVSGSFHQFKGFTHAGEYYFFNEFNLSIYIYDLKDSINEIKHIVPIPFDAAVNFRGIDGLYIHNLDSIFIYDPTNVFGPRDDLFLINYKGEIINSFKIVDLNQGETGVMESQLVAYGKIMIFHEGYMYFPGLFTGSTNPENNFMLIRYNLNTREKSLHGRFDLKDGENYATYTYAGHFDFDPISQRVYLSYAYRQDIYYFDINNLEWGTTKFKTNFFKSPEDKPNIYAFMQENTWFRDILVDTRDGTLMRKLLIPMNDIPLELEEESDGSRIASFKHVLFLIDPNTGNYSWVTDFNLFNVKFIHPEYGPMMTVQVDYEALGIDPQDYLFFAPVAFEAR